MIAGLRGRLDAKLADALLVDVGGVVYRVGTSASTVSEIGEIGEPVRLQTHLFVREDQMTLYGFATDDELKLFETLITVTGVGPRLACAILSSLRVETLHEAIQAGNADLLATVSGVGKKTAARLILELRGKLPTGGLVSAPVGRDDLEAVEVLRALGYTTAEAHAAIGRIAADTGMTTEERVVAALRELGQ
ncbi:MAG: holliday junction helicase RuvA [Thermomicrobiales bacterium]|jgi:Holliday junction DNA helicase RuvA|nr:holliday junction helicase RuvA [Thermomicrobiales bacterium]MEA2594836.1 holliday junction helicase RuvA [Thermomicrobiales bacterium]